MSADSDHIKSKVLNGTPCKNHENLLSIIKTENNSNQLVDLDTVSSLYNKLLINNSQNSTQFQIESTNQLLNNQNKLIDYI